MIPPATSPTSPNAPVTMAMPIIPSAFIHQPVSHVNPLNGTKWYRSEMVWQIIRGWTNIYFRGMWKTESITLNMCFLDLKFNGCPHWQQWLTTSKACSICEEHLLLKNICPVECIWHLQ
jgi:hypothetical protein